MWPLDPPAQINTLALPTAAVLAWARYAGILPVSQFHHL